MNIHLWSNTLLYVNFYTVRDIWRSRLPLNNRLLAVLYGLLAMIFTGSRWLHITVDDGDTLHTLGFDGVYLCKAAAHHRMMTPSAMFSIDRSSKLDAQRFAWCWPNRGRMRLRDTVWCRFAQFIGCHKSTYSYWTCASYVSTLIQLHSFGVCNLGTTTHDIYLELDSASRGEPYGFHCGAYSTARIYRGYRPGPDREDRPAYSTRVGSVALAKG